jgi:hypothetical protein
MVSDPTVIVVEYIVHCSTSLVVGRVGNSLVCIKATEVKQSIAVSFRVIRGYLCVTTSVRCGPVWTLLPWLSALHAGSSSVTLGNAADPAISQVAAKERQLQLFKDMYDRSMEDLISLTKSEANDLKIE